MFTPAEVAKNVIGIGKNKAALPAGRMLVDVYKRQELAFAQRGFPHVRRPVSQSRILRRQNDVIRNKSLPGFFILKIRVFFICFERGPSGSDGKNGRCV